MGGTSEELRSFDPLDGALEGLTDSQQKEIVFYFEWHGGDFGEYEDRIPRNPTWKYGESEEPYGWVDTERYFHLFSAAFEKLKEEIGI